MPNRVSGVSIDIVGKHGELIAAEPGQEITRPSGRPKTLGNDLQHEIPQRVAMEIIDALEVVEVYQEECVFAAIRRRRSPPSIRGASPDGSPTRSMSSCNANARSSRV